MPRVVPLSLPWTKRGSPEARGVASDIADLVLAGRLSAGQKVLEAEALFAEAHQVRRAIMVSNGTDAIRLALKAAGVQRDDEVIIPGFTFIATANAALDLGARVTAVDIREDDYCMDPEALNEAVEGNPSVKFVMPVHLYGHPADMTRIMDIADNRGLKVIEDAAQAHGAQHMGRFAGSIGLAGAFSFYATKNIGAAGEGGAVTTNDDLVAEYIGLHKGQGMGPSRYDYRILGGNERMSEIAAVSIIPQIRMLPEDVALRSANASMLTEGLKDIRGLVVPVQRAGNVHAWHQYTVRATGDARVSRDELSARLSELGIGNGVYYPQPLDEIAPLVSHDGFRALNLDRARMVSRQVLSLPVGPWLSPEDTEYIIDGVRTVLD